MKNIISSFIALFGIVSFSYGQEADQNPNYQSSLDHYTQKLENSDNTQGTTAQETYKPIDEWQDEKDLKIANKQLAIENKHERKMARINNRNRYSSSYSPYYTPSVYGNYSNAYGSRNNYSVGYGYRNNYRPTSSFHRQSNRYPIGYRISGSVRVGNVWIGI